MPLYNSNNKCYNLDETTRPNAFDAFSDDEPRLLRRVGGARRARRSLIAGCMPLPALTPSHVRLPIAPALATPQGVVQLGPMRLRSGRRVISSLMPLAEHPEPDSSDDEGMLRPFSSELTNAPKASRRGVPCGAAAQRRQSGAGCRQASSLSKKARHLGPRCNLMSDIGTATEDEGAAPSCSPPSLRLSTPSSDEDDSAALAPLPLIHSGCSDLLDTQVHLDHY